MNSDGLPRATPADVLRSLVYYTVFYGATVWLALVVSLRLMLPGQGFIHTVHSWTRFHRWCVQHILKIRVVTEGEVPGAPVLVAMKHQSYFEAIDLPVLLCRPAVFAKVELLKVPLWGRAGRHYGLIWVERDQGAKTLRAMIGAAKARTAEGRPLAIFPEGTRVPVGARPPLQPGFAGIYKLVGVPVVPIAINSGETYKRRWKKPGQITIRIGAAIPPGLPREEIEARVHTAINALNPA